MKKTSFLTSLVFGMLLAASAPNATASDVQSMEREVRVLEQRINEENARIAAEKAQNNPQLLQRIANAEKELQDRMAELYVKKQRLATVKRANDPEAQQKAEYERREAANERRRTGNGY